MKYASQSCLFVSTALLVVGFAQSISAQATADFSVTAPFAITETRWTANVVADLNGDTWPDIALAGLAADNSGSVKVLLNDTVGGFTASSSFGDVGNDTVAINAGDIAAADLDADGDVDLAVCYYEWDGVAGQFNPHRSLVFWNDGHGQFSNVSLSPVGGTLVTWDIALGDMNGDGAADIVLANGGYLPIGGALNEIFLNDGHGDFNGAGGRITFGSASGNAEHIALGDMNQDGTLDVVVRHSDWQSDGIRVYLNNSGNGTLTAGGTVFGADRKSFDFSLADVDGDGRTDIVLAEQLQSTPKNFRILVLTKTADATQTYTEQEVALQSPANASDSRSRIPVVANFDTSDSAPDIFVSARGRQSIFVRQDSSHVWQTPVDVDTSTAGGYRASPADMDQDGDLDLVETSDSGVVIHVNRSTPLFLGNDTTSTLEAGPLALPTSIDSVVSASTAQDVFSFVIRDLGGDTVPTRVSGITIRRGTISGTLANLNALTWTLVLPDSNTISASAGATSLTFPNINVDVAEGQSATFVLRVLGPSTSGATLDGDRIALALGPSDITLLSDGSRISGSQAALNNGTDGLRYSVVASKLTLSGSIPSEVFIGKALAANPPVIRYCDAHGNVDQDIGSTSGDILDISLVSGSGSPTLWKSIVPEAGTVSLAGYAFDPPVAANLHLMFKDNTAGTVNLSSSSLESGVFALVDYAVTDMTPTSGALYGGDEVFISGTGLGDTSKVEFQVSPTQKSDAFIVSKDATGVCLYAPQGLSEGSVDVILTIGTRIFEVPKQFTYYAASSIVSVTPNFGSARGGTVVTISGQNLQLVQRVEFVGMGSKTSADFLQWSPSIITLSTPPGTAASVVDLIIHDTVTNHPASIRDAFTYKSAVFITSVSPRNGYAIGGDEITITGGGFTNPDIDVVEFVSTSAAVPAQSFIIDDETSIRAIAPPGIAGTLVSVSVRCTGTSDEATMGGAHAYLETPAMAIARLTPNEAYTWGDDEIEVIGIGFTGVDTVWLSIHGRTDGVGDIPIPDFDVIDDTHIRFTTPETSNSGAYDFNLKKSGAGSSALRETGFTYREPQAIELDSVTPDHGSTTGGDIVTLSGLRMQTITNISWNGIDIPAEDFLRVTKSEIDILTPPGVAGVLGFIDALDVKHNRSDRLYAPFTYVEAFAPLAFGDAQGRRHGPISGGTRLNITGKGLLAMTEIAFGNVVLTYAAGDFSIASDNLVTVASPPVTSPQTVDFIVSDGITPVILGTFEYILPQPRLHTLSINSGPVAGGTTVRIEGINLQDATAVRFGDTPAQIVNRSDQTLIVTTAHNGTAETVDVTVVTPDGQDTLLNAFTYVWVGGGGATTEEEKGSSIPLPMCSLNGGASGIGALLLLLMGACCAHRSRRLRREDRA